MNITLIFCWWIWHVLKQTSFSWKRKIFPSYQVNAASSRYIRWWNFESVITRSLCKSVNHCKVPPVKLNKAVKRRACARGSIQAGRAPISLAKFQRKTSETTDVSRNKWNKIETFVEICKTKPYLGTGKLKTFRRLIQVRVSHWFIHSILSLSKCCRFLKTPRLTGLCGRL